MMAMGTAPESIERGTEEKSSKCQRTSPKAANPNGVAGVDPNFERNGGDGGVRDSRMYPARLAVKFNATLETSAPTPPEEDRRSRGIPALDELCAISPRTPRGGSAYNVRPLEFTLPLLAGPFFS